MVARIEQLRLCYQKNTNQPKQNTYMRISPSIENNFNFNVSVEPLSFADGTKTEICATRRLDTGAALGNCKKGYGLVQNPELIDMVEKCFSRNGLGEFKRHIAVARGGSRLFARYDFRDKVTTMPKVGDKVGLRLTANNSFDGSSRISLTMGLLRLRCTNGMVTMDSEFNLAQKHTSSVSIDVIMKALDAAMYKHSDIALAFSELSEIEVPQERGEHLLQGLVAKKILSDRVKDGISEIWAKPTYSEDSARTLWNVYNAATQYISHDHEEKHFEAAQKLNARVGSTFLGLARNPTRIQELVLAGIDSAK